MTDDGHLLTPTTHISPSDHLNFLIRPNYCRIVTILRSMTRRADAAAVLRVAQRRAAFLVTFLVKYCRAVGCCRCDDLSL